MLSLNFDYNKSFSSVYDVWKMTRQMGIIDIGMKREVKAMDTIAAISTPMGEGAIAIVRMSGPEALAIADKVYKGPRGKG